MLVKKSHSKETWYYMIANFKYNILYTNVIQITLKNPWWIPKYKNDFAGIKGLKMYGWLFFYFGRVYHGFLYPANEGNNGGLRDKNGRHWYVLGKEHHPSFQADLSQMKDYIKNGYSVSYDYSYSEDGIRKIILNLTK